MNTFACRLGLGIFLLLAGGWGGCSTESSEQDAEPSPITDETYLTAERWNDGQAEVAFYRVERSRDQYGQLNEQEFVAGTYLVKHNFDPEQMTKVTDGSGTPSFKYAFFYELESGSYQYKRNWVVNARQKNLSPLKQSFTSFDWCSNQYRELAFFPDRAIEVRMRSDDYGNRRDSFDPRPHSYPPAQLPLLVRGLDFTGADTLSFSVAVPEGHHVSAQAIHRDTAVVETEAGLHETERIELQYQTAVPSLIGEESTLTETYWRRTGPGRLLVRLEAEGGQYQMELVEHRRTAYWEENIWPELERIEERP